MLISEILNQKSAAAPGGVIRCNVSDDVMTAISGMAENKIGAVVVCGDDGVAGIFTERDVLNGLHREGAEFLTTALENSMVRKVIVVDPNRSIDDAIDLMSGNNIRHLLVIDDDAIVGVLSIRDLTARKLEAVQANVEFLKEQVKIGSKPLPM
ncbi:MAG: Hypoxic response protein 1 [Gammaproteobacteria bacterium]|nr:Hypoxic response protein 1 [Gammaproteobacteria bacterium]